MSPEVLALIAVHFACSDLADQQPLSISEIEQCTSIYEQVKLAFVPGVSAENYAELSKPEQFAVREAGYLSFLDWREANPDLVSHLEKVARGEARLTRG